MGGGGRNEQREEWNRRRGEGEGAQLIKKRAITRKTDEPKKSTRLTILMASTWGKLCMNVCM